MKDFKMVQKLMLLVLCLAMLTPLSAQSWRKLNKLAEQQFEEGNYEEAAKNFEAAYRKKSKKKELTFKAGEAYYNYRDYRKAVSAYEQVKDENKDFPLVGLKYARSLKRDRRYEKAKAAFDQFRKVYTGKGKSILEEIVKNEIAGCDLALELKANYQEDMPVLHLGPNVNSDDNEFAPLVFANNTLYFSSTIGDRARLYRSQASGDQYSKGTIPENFPLIQDQDYCHGTISQDGLRFYFTICNTSKREFSNLNSRCEIFIIRKIGDTWGQPERLPENINAANVTSTHPYIVQDGTTETLYFSSNRAGGQGGLDIWFTTRSLTGTDNVFKDPINLGAVVNTIGDEMTPFFDSEEKALYFASNGHLSIGGLDILKSRGYGNSWGKPENMGLPYNSSADDYYYSKDPNNGYAYLASNRSFTTEKLSTTHDDIFRITEGVTQKQLILNGQVFDASTNGPVENIEVSVYQVSEDGVETPLYSRSFQQADYEFDIIPNTSFRVEVSAPNYQPSSYTFTTFDPNISTYGKPVYLFPELPEPPATEEEDPFDINPDPGTSVNDPGEMTGDPEINTPGNEPMPAPEGTLEYTARGMSPADRLEYRTSAPRFTGTYYKVQLISLRSYDPNSSIYDNVKIFGDIETEYIIQKDLTRVLLARFFTEEEAREALQNARNNGFATAFAVRYDDGQRFGRIKL